MARVRAINADRFINKLENIHKITDELIDGCLTRAAISANYHLRVCLFEAQKSDDVPYYMKPRPGISSGLSGHLGKSPIKVDTRGNGSRNIKIGFAGNIKKFSPYKKKNIYVKAAYLAEQLEYGKPEYDIPCRPWLAPGIKKTKKVAFKIIRRFFSDEIKKC